MSIGQASFNKKNARKRQRDAVDYGLPYDPAQPLPWRKGQRHEFVRKMAIEASLMGGEGNNRMVISLSGKEIAPDATPLTDSDVISTNMRYRITYSFSEKGTGRLTEKAFLIECDILRPSKYIRVRSWEELVGYSKGLFGITSIKYDMLTVRWMIAFTQISRELFIAAQTNPGLGIPFSLDWQRFFRRRRETYKDPALIYRLRTLTMDSVERIRLRFRARFNMQLGLNKTFVLQHSYSDRTSMWFRKKTLTKREREELEKMDNPRRYPKDYSDMDEMHRLTQFGDEDRERKTVTWHYSEGRKETRKATPEPPSR